MRGLFAGPAPRVFTAPPSVDLLGLLARGLVESLANPDDPFALADALILAPNRRIALTLTDRFAALAPRAGLLPAIRPLGDLDGDDAWDAPGAALAPGVDPLRRRLELARLVRARDAAEGGVEDPVRALAMADALCALMDAAAAGEPVDWARLPDLVGDRDLAAHWRRSADFLAIIARYWPDRLAADDLMDPALRRAAALRALADSWRAAPPSHPVIIAGSTGSVAAVRGLMAVVARLERGLVVLPGLDREVDSEAWASVDPQHPQSALKQALAAMAIDRSAVVDLPGAEEAPTAGSRRALLREALAPADATADWLARLDRAGGPALLEAGLAGLGLVEAASAEEEASVCALALREALETPGARAALVTADPDLARRVAARLSRWGVSAVASAGEALPRTSAGALALGLLDAALDPAPLALAGLLARADLDFGLDADDFTVARQALQANVLRGPRRYRALAEMAALAGGVGLGLANALRALLDPLADLLSQDHVDLAPLARAVRSAIEAVLAPNAAIGRDQDALATLLDGLEAHGDGLGLVRGRDAPRLFERLMSAVMVAPDAPGDPRIALLGPLEARLQSFDLLVLGGLNEGVWPDPAPDDPFLSRGMRADLGLAPIEARIGLAAHDFAQLAGAGRVLLTRSRKRRGAPTVASRWLWRLTTLARGAGAEGHLTQVQGALLDRARALDAPQARRPARPPAPRPPAGARLTRISVTQVETLIRDPYAVYARRILGLEPLKAFGAAPDAASRGTAAHAALETFGRALARGEGVDATRLIALLDGAFAGVGFTPAARAAERARLAAAAEAFAAWASARAARGVVSHLEVRGAMEVAGLTLSAIADRIDLDPDGGGDIVDYKTGAPPTAKMVQSLLSPQLPLEAAMLSAGALEGLPRARPGRLIYWRIGGGDDFLQEVKLDRATADLANEAVEKVTRMLRAYGSETQPFLSKPRARLIRPYADYDHLARRAEWADAEGEA